MPSARLRLWAIAWSACCPAAEMDSQTTSKSGIVTADYSVSDSASTRVSPIGDLLNEQTEDLLGKSHPHSAKVVPVSGTTTSDASIPKGNSSDKTKAKALESLPLAQLSPENRARAEAIVHDVGFFRRTPTVTFACQPEVYTYFLDCPESAVSIWRAMEISQMRLWKTQPDKYQGDAGDGTIGTIEVLHRSPERVLVYSEGEYKSPFLKKPIIARSILHLETSFFRETDGVIYTTHRADLFVSFPSQTIETIAKVLQPLTAPIADRTFTEVSMFLKMMSVAMARRPEWVQQMAGKMQGVPDPYKNRLLELNAAIHQRESGQLVVQNNLSNNAPRIPVKNTSRVPATPASNPGRQPLHPDRSAKSYPASGVAPGGSVTRR
ncbi:MAG: hypothetical protein U0903_22190 [Planctomycetales bacterium]